MPRGSITSSKELKFAVHGSDRDRKYKAGLNCES
jgi:hypothetical protein